MNLSKINIDNYLLQKEFIMLKFKVYSIQLYNFLSDLLVGSHLFIIYKKKMFGYYGH